MRQPKPELSIHILSRRRLVAGLAAAAVSSWSARLFAEDQLLPATPGSTEGPFYPVEYPADSDNDLLRVAGQNAEAQGLEAVVRGAVLRPDGSPVAGARVEIWQCDHNGIYHHPGDRGTPDPQFQGFGATVTNGQGNYQFRTLRPVPYSGRTPHIHFRVRADGFDTLTTQLYVAEEKERNLRDWLYRDNSPAERRLITASFQPLSSEAGSPLVAEFPIVLEV